MSQHPIYEFEAHRLIKCGVGVLVLFYFLPSTAQRRHCMAEAIDSERGVGTGGGG